MIYFSLTYTLVPATPTPPHQLQHKQILARVDVLNSMNTQAMLVAGAAVASLGGESLETIDDERSLWNTALSAAFVGTSATTMAASLWVIVVSSQLITLSQQSVLQGHSSAEVYTVDEILSAKVADVRLLYTVAISMLMFSSLLMVWINQSWINAVIVTLVFYLLTHHAVRTIAGTFDIFKAKTSLNLDVENENPLKRLKLLFIRELPGHTTLSQLVYSSPMLRCLPSRVVNALSACVSSCSSACLAACVGRQSTRDDGFTYSRIDHPSSSSSPPPSSQQQQTKAAASSVALPPFLPGGQEDAAAAAAAAMPRHPAALSNRRQSAPAIGEVAAGGEGGGGGGTACGGGGGTSASVAGTNASSRSAVADSATTIATPRSRASTEAASCRGSSASLIGGPLSRSSTKSISASSIHRSVQRQGWLKKAPSWRMDTRQQTLSVGSAGSGVATEALPSLAVQPQQERYFVLRRDGTLSYYRAREEFELALEPRTTLSVPRHEARRARDAKGDLVILLCERLPQPATPGQQPPAGAGLAKGISSFFGLSDPKAWCIQGKDEAETRSWMAEFEATSELEAPPPMGHSERSEGRAPDSSEMA